MTPDEERMAEALAIERIYGEKGPLHIAARIGECDLKDDVEGRERWIAIAARYEQLLGGTAQ